MKKNHGLDAIDKINLLLEALQEYVKILEVLRGVSGKQLKADLAKRAKAERFLQLAAETCINIAEVTISDQRLPMPETSKRALEILGEAKIIDQDFIKEFSKIAGLRNILVHDYLKIDYDRIAEMINNSLDDFTKFSQQIAKFYA